MIWINVQGQKGGRAHRHDDALVAGRMGLHRRQQDAQRHFMAVGPVERVAAVFGPAGLPVVAAQDCTITTAFKQLSRVRLHASKAAAEH